MLLSRFYESLIRDTFAVIHVGFISISLLIHIVC